MTQNSITTGESAFIRSELEAIPSLTPRARETLETLPLDRDTIATMVNNLIDDTNEIEAEPYVTWDPVTALLTGSRLLVDGPNVTFSTTATDMSAELTDTGVIAGSYGTPTKLLVLAIDAKGRITGSSEVSLESGNVTETSKLFFTDARARAAISAGPGINYDPTTGIISLAPSGVSPGTYAPPASETVDIYGRITAIT